MFITSKYCNSYSDSAFTHMWPQNRILLGYRQPYQDIFDFEKIKKIKSEIAIEYKPMMMQELSVMSDDLLCSSDCSSDLSQDGYRVVNIDGTPLTITLID